MRAPFCPHEETIAGMLKHNQWPQNADPELLDHAGKCSRCGEIVFAVEMLQSGRASSVMAAHAASPGYLWWRAQLRRKSGEMVQMTRPVIWAEGLALAIILCVIAVFGFWQRAQLAGLFSSFVGTSILIGLTAILFVGGLTLFLSYRRQ
jgi:hypothetical protein